ncbi:MAG: acyloxyacyl hydrolase [Thermoanaerobaculia bacterium]
MKPDRNWPAPILVALLATLVALRVSADPPEPWRGVALGGRSFGGRPWESTDLASLAAARDLHVFGSSRFRASVEGHPFLFVRQRRLDLAGTEERLGTAVAALLVYRGGAWGAGWGFRAELGSGLVSFWDGCVPADGTRLNFLDQAGVSIVRRGGSGRTLAAGYRFVHVSNLNVFGRNRNPGVSFHAAVVSVAWRR